MDDAATLAEEWIARHAELALRTQDACAARIAAAGERLIARLREGSTIFICGNGGSAADAQHFAAELVGNFKRRERRALPAVALTVDSSALTSIGNDFGYEQVFARQLEAHGRAGDVLIGITTSGSSRNVIAAMEAAQRLGIEGIGLVGENPSRIAPYCAEVIAIPSTETAQVQEMHIMTIHIWCELIDRAFARVEGA